MIYDADKEERLSTMAEVSREIVLSEFPSAIERVQRAAAESLGVARNARARVRRQRMVSRSQVNLPAVKVVTKPEPELEMPADWRDDEDTRKITTGK